MHVNKDILTNINTLNAVQFITVSWTL